MAQHLPNHRRLRGNEIRLDGRVRSVIQAQRTFLLDDGSFATSPGRSKLTQVAGLQSVQVNLHTLLREG